MSTQNRREFVSTVLLATGSLVTTTGLVGKGLSGLSSGISSGSRLIEQASLERIWACWVGHSTVLMKLGTTWILTDPVFADVVGLDLLGLRIGPRRILPPAIYVEDIPKPDIVLLSHAHMDHTDRWTLTRLTETWPNEISVLSAAGTRDVIDDLQWKSCDEIDWCEGTTIGDVSIRALEVRHNGWRFPGERCRSNGFKRTGRSYNGYEVEFDGARIVFGGDTAYTKAFGCVKHGVDLAIMPIGSYQGYSELHCNPEEALAMTTMMGARSIMPIHHLTFRQSTEPIREPLARLTKAASDQKLHVAAGLPGSTYSHIA